MTSKFHSQLVRYINAGSFSSIDHLYYMLSAKSLFRKNATVVINCHEKFRKVTDSSRNVSANIQVRSYDGSNKHVLKMISCLERSLDSFLFGAYLHGSLATKEEIGYSDFDGLIILKNDVLASEGALASVGFELHRLQKIMHEFDPLQHHGWFVITESMLNDFPITYFPIEIFEHTVSLLPSKGLNFSVNYSKVNVDYLTPFKNLSISLTRQLKQRHVANNAFISKSLLSQFMLLPSMYLQAKNKQGIYKKHSFELARKDFRESEWIIMDQVSEIRKQWNYKISRLQRFMLSHKSAIVRKVARKYAPPVSSDVESKLTEEFYLAMVDLIQAMQSKLNVKG